MVRVVRRVLCDARKIAPPLAHLRIRLAPKVHAPLNGPQGFKLGLSIYG